MGSAVLTFNEGLARVKRGLRGDSQELMKGLMLVRQAADGGSRDAMSLMGSMLLQGKGLPKNAAEGAVWLEKAAELGDARSHFNLGLMKLRGDGVPVNKFQAGKHFKAGGELGDEGCMMHMAIMLTKGDGIPQDLQMAARWMVRSLEKGGRIEEWQQRCRENGLDPATQRTLNEKMDELIEVNAQEGFLRRKEENSIPIPRPDDRGQV